MTENTQSPEQIPAPPAIHSDELFVLMRRIRRNRPKMDLTQRRISRDMGINQSYVSQAMNNPDKYPGLSKRIWDYLTKLDHPTQSTPAQPESAQ